MKRIVFVYRNHWDTLILDEAQTIKNYYTGTSRKIRKIPADFRLALSGTPPENSFACMFPGKSLKYRKGGPNNGSYYRNSGKISVKLILCSCNFLSISAMADTWGFLERKEFYSPDKVVRFTVIPSRDFENFKVGPIGLLERKNKMGEYKLVWINKLINDITAIRAVVSNSGNYVVTIDDYLMAGHGDNTIVLYGKYGNKIANFELSDALSKEQMQKLAHSVSST